MPKTFIKNHDELFSLVKQADKDLGSAKFDFDEGNYLLASVRFQSAIASIEVVLREMGNQNQAVGTIPKG